VSYKWFNFYVVSLYFAVSSRALDVNLGRPVYTGMGQIVWIKWITCSEFSGSQAHWLLCSSFGCTIKACVMYLTCIEVNERHVLSFWWGALYVCREWQCHVTWIARLQLTVHFDFGVFSKFLSTCDIAQGFGLRLATVVTSGCRIPDEVFTSSCHVSYELTLSALHTTCWRSVSTQHRAELIKLLWIFNCE
jgi:hypothetical protein